MKRLPPFRFCRSLPGARAFSLCLSAAMLAFAWPALACAAAGPADTSPGAEAAARPADPLPPAEAITPTNLGATDVVPAAIAATTRPGAVAHPALWRLSRGATTIYLFGTVHALPAGVDWFAGPVARAYGASGELVTEIIDRSPAEMRAIVVARALLPPGQNLREMLARPFRARFEQTLRTNGLPVNAFDGFRPWYAAVVLSTRPLLASGFDPALGADAELAARATREARKHEALETAEYQLGLFATLPSATQLRYLREVVRDMPSIQRELHAMVHAWEAGDAPHLARLMNEDNDDPHMRELLLVDRNKAWAQWISARLSRPGTVFVAVGAGHLAGPESVQVQLAAMGISATRIQ